MEQDRDIANIGPDDIQNPDVESKPPPKQPKRRIVGRRAATEKAAAHSAQDGEGNNGTSDALSGMRTL